MTVHELSQLFYIKKLIERDSLRLAELEARLEPGGMNFSGMPRNPNPKNPIEEVVPLIIDIKEQIKKRQEEYFIEQKRIEKYIETVPDYHIKLIISLRCVDLLTWQQVAARIGGSNTEGGVKKAFYRFMKKEAKK